MNTREVTAIARGTTKNMFMSVLGRTTLPIYGRSTAAEGVSNIEVSLVLDISGSMGGQKIEEMRAAAGEFVDIVLDPSQAETVTVSLVPYNGKVNAGSLMNDYYTFSDQRLAANCVRFSATQFNMVGLQNNEHPERLARFDKNTGGWANSIQDPHCQTSDFGAILPWSNDPTELKTHINTLQAGGWTAIDLGMKWASILLDPTSQDELSAMATDGHVEPRFVGRPSNYYTPNKNSNQGHRTSFWHWIQTERCHRGKTDTQSTTQGWNSTTGWKTEHGTHCPKGQTGIRTSSHKGWSAGSPTSTCLGLIRCNTSYRRSTATRNTWP